MKKLVLVLCIFVVSSVLFAGGTEEQKSEERAAEPTKSVLKMANWEPTEPGLGPVWEHIINGFKDETGIEVQFEVTPFPRYVDNLVTRISGGEPQDVVMVMTDMLYYLQSLDLIQPLEQWIDLDKYKDRLKSDYLSASIDGHLYGMLLVSNNYGMYYNQRLLNEAGVEVPTTAEEFYAAVKKLTVPPDQFGYAFRHTTPERGGFWYDISNWVFGFNGQWAKDGELTIDHQSNIEAVTLYKKFYDEKLIPQGVDAATYRRMYWNGKIAFMIDNMAVYPILTNGNPDIASDVKTAIPPWPRNTASVAFSAFFCIPKGAKNTEGAVKFIEWMSQPEQQRYYMENRKLLPALKGIITDEFLQKNEYMTAFSNIPTGMPVVIPGFEDLTSDIRDIILNNIVSLLTKGGNVEAGMKKAQQEAQDFVRRRRQ